MQSFQVSLIPAVRCSAKVRPVARIWSEAAGECALRVDGEAAGAWPVAAGALLEVPLDLSAVRGAARLAFELGGARVEFPYEVLDTGVASTTLLDGCWVDIYHWSEAEGRPFNAALGRLTDAEWREQIRAMAEVGIRGAVIQDVFHLDEYVGKHSLTVENYSGLAFYPSALYPGRCPIAAEDPIEAILAAADEFDVHVAVGIGLFAWFDFTDESLRWHKRVAREVWDRYGHHRSFYGFYVSEEVAGSLYFEDFHPCTRPEQWREIERFFREFRAFCAALAPTKPILFAANNIHFEQYGEAWAQILRHIDILLVFAFARDPEHLNVREIKRICEGAGCHFFVDLEVFKFPFDDTGLVPKDIGELVREIRVYDEVEQIYGYEYTGHLNHEGGPDGLGGAPAKALYREYANYVAQTMRT